MADLPQIMDANLPMSIDSQTVFPWLSLIVLLPIVGALIMPFLPTQESKNSNLPRNIALVILLADFLIVVFAFANLFDPNSESLQLVERLQWLPSIGLEWSLGVDGISAPLVVLSGLITFLSAAASWKVKQKTRLYFALLLIQASAQALVFLSQDFLLFFLAWELELVPVYLLIAIWGGKRKLYAATKFILYTALASLLILISGLALALSGDQFTFNLSEIAAKSFTGNFGIFCYLGFLIGFGVKLPIFPLHTWLPDAHGEANAPVSMLLAGVLLKMGGYGFLRFSIPMFPDASIYFTPLVYTMSVIAVIYTSLTTLRQVDMKRIIAYSSVAHMGFVTIGMFTLNIQGIEGSMLLMLSHGIVSSALFLCVGVVYDRHKTRIIKYYSGLTVKMPIFSIIFLFFIMANIGFPGTSSFVSEFLVLIGAFKSNIFVTVLAATGVIWGAGYSVWLYNRVAFGNIRTTHIEAFQDVNRREFMIFLPCIILVLLMGIYPEIFLNVMHVSITNLIEQTQ